MLGKFERTSDKIVRQWHSPADHHQRIDIGPPGHIGGIVRCIIDDPVIARPAVERVVAGSAVEEIIAAIAA